MKKNVLSLVVLLAGAACLLSALSRDHHHTTPAAAISDPTFRDFLKQFPARNLPFSIDKDDLAKSLNAAAKKGDKQRSRGNYLSGEYTEFLPGLRMFSRMPEYAEPVAMFETEQHYAVVYNMTHGFARPWKNYKITVYDKKGEAISNNYLAGTTTDEMTTATISADLQVVQTKYRVIWEKDYRANGIDGNAVDKFVPGETASVDLTQPTENIRRRETSPVAPPVVEEKLPEPKS